MTTALAPDATTGYVRSNTDSGGTFTRTPITVAELLEFFTFNPEANPPHGQYTFNENYQADPANPAKALDQQALDAATAKYGTTGYEGAPDQAGPFTLAEIAKADDTNLASGYTSSGDKEPATFPPATETPLPQFSPPLEPAAPIDPAEHAAKVDRFHEIMDEIEREPGSLFRQFAKELRSLFHRA